MFKPVKKDVEQQKAEKDLRDFFHDPNYSLPYFGRVGDRAKDPYYKKQLEVIFEKKHFHWITGRAIGELIDRGQLEIAEKPKIRGTGYIFVKRSDIRYHKKKLKERIKLIENYSNPDILKGVGEWTETLFKTTLQLQGFAIEGEHTAEFQGRRYTATAHDLDFIIQRDGISYGVQVKNELGYPEEDELDIYLSICDCLGITFLGIFRNAPEPFITKIKARGGYTWIYKTHFYPPGFYSLVARIWNKMRLPVHIWKELPPGVKTRFLNWHETQISK